jgi:hypothetical protein
MRGFLRRFVVPPEVIETYLDPDARVWAYFHPRYGYLLRNSMMRDGIDGSLTVARYEPNGQRRQLNFADEPCRLNSYGDSFTQGHQVSDGETWQEVLAAHFCEPIRNYGVGGFGVYQAALRLIEHESTEHGAPFVILNLWGDDHLRSINSWRWLTFPPHVVEAMSGPMFHGNPWDHARLDPQTGDLVEKASVCPTPEALRRLCDEDFVYATFADDPVVHALAAIETGVVADRSKLDELATAAGFAELDFSTPEVVKDSVERLYRQYAVRVGIRVIEKVIRFTEERGKNLFVLLSHPHASVREHCAGEAAADPDYQAWAWHPDSVKDFLRDKGVPFLDTVDRHVEDFRGLGVTPEAYVKRYYKGHYNPLGNHFFAYAVKDTLLEWLDPAPPAYRAAPTDQLIDFQGYLPA